jgi:hypothetical protein
MTDFRDAFPDLNFQGVGDLIAEGDYVVGRWEVAALTLGQLFAISGWARYRRLLGEKWCSQGQQFFALSRGVLPKNWHRKMR